MLVSRRVAATAGAVALLLLSTGMVFSARADSATGHYQMSLLGGVQGLNHSQTGLPATFVDIPVTLSLDYELSPVWAVDGDFSWVIPVSRSVNLGTSGSQDRKTPDVVTYQANVVAKLPPRERRWSPYVTAGAGAVRFLSNSDVDRLPGLSRSETDFAINFGAGTTYGLRSRWALRADFRELAAFPSNNAPGFSIGSKADAIWMERAAVGLAYRI